MLHSNPESSLDLMVSPLAREANENQFASVHADDSEDLLLELLRHGASREQDEFLVEMHEQRGAERVEK